MYFNAAEDQIRCDDDDDYKRDDCDGDYDCCVDDDVYVDDKEYAITAPRTIITDKDKI